MTAIPSPTITLNSGHDIPQLGFGVFKVDPDETERIVSDALEVGYRHLDTAKIYGNEAGVGRAIAKSGIAREELFVTTKLWNDDQADPEGAFQRSLEELGLDYVDLYLIHWPVAERGTYVDAWKGLQTIAESGRARSVGVSNFQPKHLDAILAEGGILPAVNQVELHPAFQQWELRDYLGPKGIQVESWGPLGQGKYELGELPGLQGIADAHGKSVQQVAIRWHLQEGLIVFPKSSSKERIAQNADVFDFELSDAELDVIRKADQNRRVGGHPDEIN
jgi:2,5-diketo-D-gluconate reductase A